MNLAIAILRCLSKPAFFAAHIAVGLTFGIVAGDIAVELVSATAPPAAMMRDAHLARFVPHLSQPGARG